MRKTIIAILLVSLIFGMSAFPVFAVGTGSLSVSGAEGKQGDTVTVAVNLSSNPGLITMKFAVSYPSDLELTKVENSGLLGGWTTPAPTISSPYTIRWADSLATTNNTATGKIVTLTFKIKDSATPGNKTVSVTFNESRDAEGGKNTFGNASATIKISCKSHSYGSYTSTGDAQHSRTCSACGNKESANHNWNSGTINKQPSCKETGEKTYTCTTCNGTKKETLPKTNDHSYSAWSVVDADTHKRTCSICQNVESAKHDWDAGRVNIQPSCKETGQKTYTCKTCYHKTTENLPKTNNHSYGAWTKVNDSTHKHTCSVCAKKETANHTWNSGVVTKKATCKAAGTKTYTCTTCNATKTAAIAKLTKHTYSNNCDTTCNVCNAKRTAPHTYSNSCDTSCNSCKAKRTIKHTYSNNCDTKCNVCSKTRKITHTYKTVTTKATLTKNGKTVKRCSVCGKVSSTKTIKYVKTVKLSTTSYTYNGKAKTPSVTVKDSAGKTLKKNTDYTVTYASGRKNVGTYTVTIKMKGNYSGTKVLTFKIDPAKTSVSKLTAGKGSITAAWKKVSQVTGYQIQYSTSKSFSGAKTVTIAGGSTTKYVLKSLKGKKEYYVRVRALKKVGNTTFYSGWSASKNVKTK